MAFSISSNLYMYKLTKWLHLEHLCTKDDKNKCPHYRCRVTLGTFSRQEITEGAKDPLTEKFLAESFLELIRGKRVAFHIAFTWNEIRVVKVSQSPVEKTRRIV